MNVLHQISETDIAARIIKIELYDMGFKRQQVDALFEMETIENAN